MKKLAVVVDTFPRWSERFIARELQELRRRGVDLSVFCLKAGTEPALDDPDWVGLLERRVVLPACLTPRALAGRGSSPALKQRVEEARCALELSYFSRIKCAGSLAQLLREGGYGHVHAHFANLPSTVGWLAAAELGLPFSFSVHARDLFVEPQLLEQKLRDGVGAFCCHARARESLTRMGSPTGRAGITLMRHGLPLERFPYEPRRRKAGDPLRLMAAGRFVPKKGFEALIEAVAAGLADENIEVTVLGEGPGGRKLSGLLRRKGLQDRVRICAPCGGAALARHFAAAHLFVAPYRQADDGDSDGVPNVLLEAFALGLPVIGTDAGSLPEILDATTGTVAPAGDCAALAAALRAFARDPQPAEKKSRRARERIEREYDIRKNIEPLAALLR